MFNLSAAADEVAAKAQPFEFKLGDEVIAMRAGSTLPHRYWQGVSFASGLIDALKWGLGERAHILDENDFPMAALEELWRAWVGQAGADAGESPASSDS